MSTQTVDTKEARTHPLWKTGITAAGLAAGVNALLYLVFSAGGILPPATFLPTSEAKIALLTIVALAAMAALGGTALYALLSRKTRHPIRALVIVGAVILLLAFPAAYSLAPGGFLAISPADCGVAAVLELMHGITAVITIGEIGEWNRKHVVHER